MSLRYSLSIYLVINFEKYPSSLIVMEIEVVYPNDIGFVVEESNVKETCMKEKIYTSIILRIHSYHIYSYKLGKLCKKEDI